MIRKFKWLIISVVILCCIFTMNAVINNITKYNVLDNVSKTFLSVFGIYRDEVNYFEFSDDIVYIGSGYEWKDKNEFEVTIGINSKLMVKENNKDIIFMIDTSSSMDGEKIDIVKELVYYVSYDVLENENNNVSLITFNDTANLLCDFTNDITLIDEKLGNVEFNNDTNYNLALKKLDEVLNSYEYSIDRELSVLFITDGNASKETNNHASTYKILKEKYPYLNISGVLFEKGLTGKLDINDVTDKWILSSGYETVNPVLELLNVTDKFENINFSANLNDEFEIISYNSYSGKIDVIDNKFVWNMSNKYISGSTELLTLRLRLKESIFNNLGHYKLFDSTNISYKLLNGEDRILNTNGSLIVTNGYTVHYDLNLPSGCNVSKINDKKYLISSSVDLEKDLFCNGYVFLGYDVDGVSMINDKSFIMPSNDVVVKASWEKYSVGVTLDGQIREAKGLYDTMEEMFQTSSIVKQYTNVHKDSFTLPATHDIYHFYANNNTLGAEVLENNNVIFADHCWQILRTTDTGGVKLIYNGEVDSNGKCGTDRGGHVGYNGTTNIALNKSYYYSNDYEYNSLTNKFSLAGDKELLTWSDGTFESMIGKYTCMSADINGECDKLHWIDSYVSSTKAFAIQLITNAHYAQFGTLKFNNYTTSAAYVGYMYGEVYEYGMIKTDNILDFEYGENVIWNGSGYTISNLHSLQTNADVDTLTNNRYVCLEGSVESCTKTAFVYYYDSANGIYYLVLKEDDGDVDEILDKMFKHNTNTSLIKKGLEIWYEKYLLEYSNFLEDFIYCNNRSYVNYNESGFNTNGGSLTVHLKFQETFSKSDFSCPSVTDQFSVSNEAAKNKYPIGLATAPEMLIIGNDLVRNSGYMYWLGSPNFFNGNHARGRYVFDGRVIGCGVEYLNGVRPVISLKPGIEYVGGNGSVESPYLIG